MQELTFLHYYEYRVVIYRTTLWAVQGKIRTPHIL